MKSALEPGAYRPTKADRLWLLRAVEGEGAPANWVAQALVNRFMWLRAQAAQQDKAPPYATLTDFVRAYAQPVNPRWMRGGDKFEERWKAAGLQGRKKLEAQDARRRAHSKRTEFSTPVMAAVERALTMGPVDLPRPDTTDYSAPNHETPPHLVVHSGHTAGVNSFYGAKAARGWQGYSVALKPAVGEASVGVGLVLVFGLFLVSLGSKKS